MPNGVCKLPIWLGFLALRHLFRWPSGKSPSPRAVSWAEASPETRNGAPESSVGASRGAISNLQFRERSSVGAVLICSPVATPEAP